MNPEIDLSHFQRFSSRVLWHFTGYDKTAQASFSILNAILGSSCLQVASKPERIRMSDGAERFGFPFSCMCDIPFGDLRIHMARYGQFGLAFHKEPSITKGHFNPILYIHKESALFKHASDMVSSLDRLVDEGHPVFESLQSLLRALGSFSKRGDLTHPATLSTEKDQSQDNNFYFEREWRSVYSWNFSDVDIAAIMMPASYVSEFRRLYGDRFPSCSIISSEMVAML